MKSKSLAVLSQVTNLISPTIKKHRPLIEGAMLASR